MADQNEVVDEMGAQSDGVAQEQGGGVGRAAIALQGPIDVGSACWIKSSDPVIDDQQAWVAGQEYGQGYQSPLLMAEVADFHASGQVEFRHESVKVIIVPLGKTTTEKDRCLANGHHFIDALAVLHYPDLLTEIHGQRADVMAVNQALSGSGRTAGVQQFKDRRLAKRVLGGEHGQASLGHGEIKVLA